MKVFLSVLRWYISAPGGGEGGGAGDLLAEDQACAEGSWKQGAVYGLVQRQTPTRQLVSGTRTRTHILPPGGT